MIGSLTRRDSSRTMGPRKPVEGGNRAIDEKLSKLLGSASGSDPEMYRHSQMQTQNPVDIKGRASPRLSLTDRRCVGAPSSTPFRPIMDRLPGTRAALRAYSDLAWDKGEGRGHSSGSGRPLGAAEGLSKPKFDANPSQS